VSIGFDLVPTMPPIRQGKRDVGPCWLEAAEVFKAQINVSINAFPYLIWR
jgi:hypothetical protein